MANTILAKFLAVVTPAISLASVANGAGRISDQIDNTAVKATRGILSLRTKTGAVAPTANTLIKIFLIRNSNGGVNIQGGRLGASLGAVDAAVAVEPINAECVGAIQVNATVSNTYDENFIVQDPGPLFSFVVWNGTGQALDATAGSHVLEWSPIVDEVQ